MSSIASPIADLTYRNYDGPLEAPIHRWWAIAKMSIRLAVKKKGFWIWSVISAYWYLVMIAVFYFVDTFAQNSPIGNGQNPFFSQLVWKDQFLNAFSIAQLLLFIVALLIGSGTIANDNRANALLVYLSKPCSKLDYLIGKWFGIFLPIMLVTAAPMLLFYAYGALSYRQYGFLHDDPWLILKLLAIIPIPGIFHASLSIGISSLFNQGRLAGATYAGLYFFTLFFTKAMQVVHIASSVDGGVAPSLVDKLYYASCDGLQIGLAKAILNTSGGPLFPGMGGPMGRNRTAFAVPPPHLVWVLPLFLGICAACVFLAWSRIRAVEVVS